MVKRSNKPHRKQTKSELLRKKKSSHTAFQRQSDFVHPSIKAAWDPRRTLRQNYIALGLSADPNERKQRQRQSERLPQIDIDATEEELKESWKGKKRKRTDSGEDKRVEGGTLDDRREGEEEDDEEEEGNAGNAMLSSAAQQLHAELLEMQRIGNVASRYEVKSMSLNEQRRLQRLIAKHGQDLQAMARDISLNIQQETTSQLRKRIALYQRLQHA